MENETRKKEDNTMKKTIVTIFAAGLVFEAIAASMKDSLQPYVDSGELPGAISVLYDNGRQEVSCVSKDYRQ